MFNPNEHMMKLKGKDYLQVAWRLVWFREDHPDYTLDTTALTITDDHAIFKTTISDAQGHTLSTGHGSESKKDFGDFIEKAETKSVGRALAMLGYGTQFAADELDEGERIVDSPIDRKPQEKPKGTHEAAQTAGEKKLEEINKKLEATKAKPATPEQLAIIREEADEDTFFKAMQAFGPHLENLTQAKANTLIKRIREGGAA